MVGAPPLEVTLDNFAFGACTTECEACSICMTLALEMCDLATELFCDGCSKLVAPPCDEAICLHEGRARRSRRKQRIAGDNRCMNRVTSRLTTCLCRVETQLCVPRITDGGRKLTDARSFGACPDISHGSEPVVGHTAMLH